MGAPQPTPTAARAALQPALQDYLKAVHRLTETEGYERASTSGIAKLLGVSPPSVSAMLDRMAAEGLIDYVHYAGASLTADGRTAALRVIRRHRLVELFLVTHLGLGWDEVHEEAEVLEHALSQRVEAAIDEALGHPDCDPHGDPIPAADGSLEPVAWRSLWETADAAPARVTRVSDADPELLRHLQKLGIVPGTIVSSIHRDSGGVVRLGIGGREAVVGREAAEKVYVDPV